MSQMKVSTITTDRCQLDSLVESDSPDIFRLVQCPETRRYLGGPVDSTAFPDRFRAMLGDGATHHWVVRLREGGGFVGLISLGPHHDGLDQEVSYQFLPEVWGRGLASESLHALLIEALERFRLDSIIAETQTANTRSTRLLENLDFQQERLLVRFDAEQTIYRLHRWRQD